VELEDDEIVANYKLTNTKWNLVYSKSNQLSGKKDKAMKSSSFRIEVVVDGDIKTFRLKE
jgi:hypothetical protein